MQLAPNCSCWSHPCSLHRGKLYQTSLGGWHWKQTQLSLVKQKKKNPKTLWGAAFWEKRGLG